jgi:hypothetical protein
MKHLTMLCASASLLLATQAIASQKSADLAVAGTIVPGGACTASIPSDLSLGTISRGSLDPDPSKWTDLESRRIHFTVSCTQETRFALIMREGSNAVSEGNTFPLYANDTMNHVGKFYLRVDNSSTRIDGVVGYPTASDRKFGLEQASWGPSMPGTVTLPIPNNLFAVGFVDEADSTKVPLNIRELKTALMVTPRINPANELDFSGETAFTSNLGVEIVYF